MQCLQSMIQQGMINHPRMGGLTSPPNQQPSGPPRNMQHEVAHQIHQQIQKAQQQQQHQQSQQQHVNSLLRDPREHPLRQPMGHHPLHIPQMNHMVTSHIRSMEPNSQPRQSCEPIPEKKTDQEELEQFVKTFQQKRIMLGFSQRDVSFAITKLHSDDFTQMAISRFETHDFSLFKMYQLRAILQKWLQIVYENHADSQS